MSLTLTLPYHTEAQLRELAQQQGVSTETYVAQLLESFTRQQDLREATETQLLQQLDLGFSEREWGRYHHLVGLRQDGRLGEAEHQELLALSSRLEHANVRRMGVLAELAKRRQIPVEQLVHEVASRNPTSFDLTGTPLCGPEAGSYRACARLLRVLLESAALFPGPFLG